MAVLKKTFTQEYAKFDGRVSKQDFWNWTLAVTVVICSLSVLGQVIGAFNYLVGLVGLATLIPNIGMGIRRCHDLDKAGTFVLVNLICCIGTIFFLYNMWGEGNPADNQYGPVPEDTPAEQ